MKNAHNAESFFLFFCVLLLRICCISVCILFVVVCESVCILFTQKSRLKTQSDKRKRWKQINISLNKRAMIEKISVYILILLLLCVYLCLYGQH